MIKRLYIYIIPVFILFGCDKYLDELPDDRQEIKTQKNVAELLVSAYPYASYVFLEWKTDNVMAVNTNNQLPQLTENFQYLPVVSDEDQDTPTYFWNASYSAIAHSNQALLELENIPNDDNDYKNALKAEALITRAYNHFMLANVFCQHYSTETASDLGIPYITAPESELRVSYDRGTLQETYDNIEKDLLEALPLISDEYYEGSGKYHFNKNAAYAFASRFYLFKGDFVKCLEYSNKLLGSGVPSQAFIRDMAEVFNGTNVPEIAMKFYDVLEPANLMVIRNETAYVTRTYYGYQCTSDIFDEVHTTVLQGLTEDFRDARWGISDDRVPPKYNELFKYTTSTTGLPYYIHPAFRAEEVIFNRMEAYVMLNRVDEALADYNTLAPFRYANGGQLSINEIVNYFGASEQVAMFIFVITERRKEFLREGLRWFDIKRFGIPVRHIDITGAVFDLQSEDLRRAIQIPASAIAQGIEANPR